MIEEAYVSFEVAKLLQEKGFDEKCTRWYVANEPQEGIVEKGFGENQFYINAPTHQMAMAWLREVHKVNIEIHYNRFGENYKYLIIYKPEILDDIRSLGVFYHYEEAVEEAIKYSLENLI